MARPPLLFDLTACARVLALRKLRGLSRSAVADMAGITVGELQRYELGLARVPDAVLPRIAASLGRSADDMCQRQPAPEAMARPGHAEDLARKWRRRLLASAPQAVHALRNHVGIIRNRVLLVDDDVDVLVTISAFLGGAGLHALTAATGEAAMRIIHSEMAIDAIVADYAMPGISGLDTLMRAQRLRPGVPGLLITGCVDVDTLSGFPDSIDVLPKPFRRAELIRRVRSMVAATPCGLPLAL